MRDPDRIDQILPLLWQVWHRYPDLRLGQLVIGIAGEDDAFNLEDDDTEQRLREWLETPHGRS